MRFYIVIPFSNEVKVKFSDCINKLKLKTLDGKFTPAQNLQLSFFSISETKRIEVKSTLKSSRTHHFRHEQLRSEIYDIKVVSYMLRKCDYGLSLRELIEKIQEAYAENYALLLHIESLIAHVDKSALDGLKYDTVYLKENLRFYDARNVPHFNERTPDGVFNAEYDCCLDTATTMAQTEIVGWIKEG